MVRNINCRRQFGDPQFDWLNGLNIHATDIDGFISQNNRFFIWDRKTTWNDGLVSALSLRNDSKWNIEFPYGQLRAYQSLAKAITNVDAKIWIKDAHYIDEPNLQHILIADIKSLNINGHRSPSRGASYVLLNKDEFELISLQELRKQVTEWWLR